MRTKNCIWGNCQNKAVFKLRHKSEGNEPYNHVGFYCKKHMIGRIASWTVEADYTGQIFIERLDKKGIPTRPYKESVEAFKYDKEHTLAPLGTEGAKSPLAGKDISRCLHDESCSSKV